jgi:hypothetical protein
MINYSKDWKEGCMQMSETLVQRRNRLITKRRVELEHALKDLADIALVAIKDGDWVVDGACDPDSALCRAYDLVFLEYHPQEILSSKQTKVYDS